MANVTFSSFNVTAVAADVENCTEYDDEMLSSDTSAYVVPVIFAIIFIVGVIGNGTTILIVVHNKMMRNVPNIFIVSLAAGDLLLLLVSVPFTSTIYTFKYWPYGVVVCKLNEYLQTLSLGVSVFTLTALSWDRYTAIASPMQRAKGNMLKRTSIITGIIWVVSATLAIMDGYKTNIMTHEKQCARDIIFCTNLADVTYSKFKTIFRFLVYFIIPMVCISIFYIFMALTLVKSSQQMLNEGQAVGTSTIKQISARKKVAKVILSFVVVFVLCWMPHHIFSFWYNFDPANFNEFWNFFKVASFCLSYINSCVNPVALYLLSRQFRGYFHKYLLCCIHFRATSKPEIPTQRPFRGPPTPNTGYTCMTAKGKGRSDGVLFTYSNDTRLQKSSLSSEPEMRLKKTILSGDMI